jgi:flavin reductase (DIM6/NTAB) family NADH-FMN oxidoreductase RutF
MSAALLSDTPARLLRAEYVDAMAGLAGGVTVVTAVDAQDRPVGMTTTSAVSVSADPPMLAVAMAGGRTLSAVRQTGRFCVNILNQAGREAAQVFASGAADKFRGLACETGPNGVRWLPTLTSHALHCSVVVQVPAGDHLLFVGQVSEVSTGRRREPHRGLVYWRHRWHELA